MRYRLMRIAAPLIAAPLLAVGGCSREKAPPSETAAAAPELTTPPDSTPLVSAPAAGTLAPRSELPEILSRARDALAKRDSARSATELRSAVRVMRQQADSLTDAARKTTHDAAHELDLLAINADRGEFPAPAQVTQLFRQASRADADAHRAHAVMAWARRDTVRTGEELLMALDDIMPAATDAPMPLDTTAQRDIERVRTVGNALTRKSLGKADDVSATLETLAGVIHRAGARTPRGER